MNDLERPLKTEFDELNNYEVTVLNILPKSSLESFLINLEDMS